MRRQVEDDQTVERSGHEGQPSSVLIRDKELSHLLTPSSLETTLPSRTTMKRGVPAFFGSCSHRHKLARPIALLIGLAEMRDVDLGPLHLLVPGQSSQPSCIRSSTPCSRDSPSRRHRRPGCGRPQACTAASPDRRGSVTPAKSKSRPYMSASLGRHAARRQTGSPSHWVISSSRGASLSSRPARLRRRHDQRRRRGAFLALEALPQPIYTIHPWLDLKRRPPNGVVLDLIEARTPCACPLPIC